MSFLLGFVPPPLLSRGEGESVEKKGVRRRREEELYDYLSITVPIVCIYVYAAIYSLGLPTIRT